MEKFWIDGVWNYSIRTLLSNVFCGYPDIFHLNYILQNLVLNHKLVYYVWQCSRCACEIQSALLCVRHLHIAAKLYFKIVFTHFNLLNGLFHGASHYVFPHSHNLFFFAQILIFNSILLIVNSAFAAKTASTHYEWNIEKHLNIDMVL